MEKISTIDLEKRVWRAVESSADPAGLSSALENFLPNCTFGVSDEVPTARISTVAGHTAIEFGSTFLETELSDDRDFMFVLLHEVYHNVLGHLRHSRGDRVSRIYRDLSNIAADMLVNRAVCARFFPGGVPLLGRMYSWDTLPAALLRPPPVRQDGQIGHAERARVIKRFEGAVQKLGAPKRMAVAVWSVYRLAWLRAAPYEVVFERLMALFASIDPLMLPPIVLIGNHEGKLGGLGTGGDVFGRAAGKEAGFSEEVEEELHQIERVVANQGVAAALRRALEEQKNRLRMYDPIACPGVVCIPGRRDVAFLASGAYPVFYHANKTEFQPEEQAHVYVDVSGSMVDEIPRMFGVLAASREMIADPIHEFSNVIEDVTMSEFQKGVCRTTGGTDFSAIMEHALERDYRQIVVFTDGFASFDDAVGARFVARKIKLHLVFVDSHADSRSRCVLMPIACSTFVMS